MRLCVLVAALLGSDALQLRSAPLTRAHAARRTAIPIACEAPETTDTDEGPGFTDGFLAAAGLFANPIAACSLYNVAATGSGLPAGPYDLLGALEGVSFLVVAGICVAALVSKVTKGSGLPAGPFGLLGLSEGLSFLSLFAALLVFPLKEFGIVGDPQTAAVDVPAATAAAAAFLAPLVAQGLDAAGSALSGLSDGSISGGEGGLPSFDMSSIKLPDVSSLGLPDVSGLSLPSIDGLSLPDVSGLSLPDVSGLSLPDVSGLSMPDVSGLSMPEVKMPEGLPAMPETKATIPDLPPMPTMGF